MTSSPAGSTTPFSDYTSSRGHRGLTIADDNRVIEVYILKNTTDPILVLVPVARAETYSAFWSTIKNDLYPGSSNAGDEAEMLPMVFLLDPFMTRLRLELWSDLVPSLRGKRLLVLPGDAAPPPFSDETKSFLLPQYKKSTWTNLNTKSSPIIPETSLVTVDAQPQLSSTESKKPTRIIPEASSPRPESLPYPVTSPPRSTAEPKPRPKVKIEDRSVSFFKTPEFAFDIALWCRFAPSYKPSLLMHFQFREIVVQVVPTSKGLSVRNMTSKISSALTNMLRRQGCLGTLTSSPMSDFRDLLVKSEFLKFALEDWPSSKESLGLTAETLRWIQEPVLLYCEIQDVHFPQRHEKHDRPNKKTITRRVEIESASEEELE